MPAAVSMGVVTPTVIVQRMNDSVYTIMPFVPELDKLSSNDVIECWISDGDGIGRFAAAEHGDEKIKAADRTTEMGRIFERLVGFVLCRF